MNAMLGNQTVSRVVIYVDVEIPRDSHEHVFQAPLTRQAKLKWGDNY